MKRLAILLYGSITYLLFLGTFGYAALWIERVLVPTTLNTGVESSTRTALLVNLGMLSAFALQHNIMARSWFKARWTRIVHPAIERSTYVLATLVLLNCMFVFWRPIPAVVWELDGVLAPILTTLSWLGLGVVLLATFAINHLELIGVEQVVQHYRGTEPTPVPFQVSSLYRFTRHPLYLGFFMAFWCTPLMTIGHLLFAGVVTLWVLLTVRLLEEKDLVREHGEEYRAYQQRVPMILPLPKRGAAKKDGLSVD